MIKPTGAPAITVAQLAVQSSDTKLKRWSTYRLHVKCWHFMLILYLKVFSLRPSWRIALLISANPDYGYFYHCRSFDAQPIGHFGTTKDHFGHCKDNSFVAEIRLFSNWKESSSLKKVEVSSFNMFNMCSMRPTRK